MYHTIVCRYNEIATKGNNRGMFERHLIENMRYFCCKVCPCKISKVRGRILIHKTDNSVFSESESDALTENLKRCFGLDSFSFCLLGEPSMESVKSMVSSSAPERFKKQLLLNSGLPVQFRTRARRSDKSFPLDSKGIEIEIATLIESITGTDHVKVNLTNPQISIGVEIREKHSLVYYDTIKAAGGLPVGCNAPVLALLSGGIDSPVACNMVMKRGCHTDFLTFHSFPYTPMESVDKVRRLAEIINRWQRNSFFYSCNISEIQKLIRDHCNPRYRTVLYRRMMMRIASRICEAKGLGAIVTGESVGQVASQTVENMSVINESTPYLILRPLCGLDKNETIERARKLETFEVSIEPMADSCTVFAPDSPVLHAELKNVQWEESKIPNLEEAVQNAFDSIEAEVIR